MDVSFWLVGSVTVDGVSYVSGTEAARYSAASGLVQASFGVCACARAFLCVYRIGGFGEGAELYMIRSPSIGVEFDRPKALLTCIDRVAPLISRRDRARRQLKLIVRSHSLI